MNSPSELPSGKFDQSDNRLTANPAFRLLSTVATAGEKFMDAVVKVQGVVVHTNKNSFSLSIKISFAVILNSSA